MGNVPLICWESWWVGGDRLDAKVPGSTGEDLWWMIPGLDLLQSPCILRSPMSALPEKNHGTSNSFFKNKNKLDFLDLTKPWEKTWEIQQESDLFCHEFLSFPLENSSLKMHMDRKGCCKCSHMAVFIGDAQFWKGRKRCILETLKQIRNSKVETFFNSWILWKLPILHCSRWRTSWIHRWSSGKPTARLRRPGYNPKGITAVIGGLHTPWHIMKYLNKTHHCLWPTTESMYFNKHNPWIHIFHIHKYESSFKHHVYDSVHNHSHESRFLSVLSQHPVIKSQARWNIQRRLRRCDRFSRAFLGLLAYDQQPGVEKIGENWGNWICFEWWWDDMFVFCFFFDWMIYLDSFIG